MSLCDEFESVCLIGCVCQCDCDVAIQSNMAESKMAEFKMAAMSELSQLTLSLSWCDMFESVCLIVCVCQCDCDVVS